MDLNYFPLLRLPFIVLQEVLKSISPFELIKFSEINRRTKTIAKTFSRNKANENRYALTIDMSRNKYLSIKRKRTTWFHNSEANKLIYRHESIRVNDIVIKTFRISSCGQMMSTAEYLMDILNCKVASVIFDSDVYPKQCAQLIYWLKVRTKSLESLELIGKDFSEKTVTQLLDNLKITLNLDLSIEMSDNFIGELPKGIFQLVIKYGKWISLEQLLSIDSTIIRLEENSLSLLDLNTFFESWMAAKSNQNLKFIQIYVNDNAIAELVRSLRGITHDLSIVRKLIIGTVALEVRGGTDIKRIDGATGTVHILSHNHGKILSMILVN